MIRLFNTVCLLLLFATSSKAQQTEKASFLIPVAGNSFEIGYQNERTAVRRNNVHLSPNTQKVSTYFKLANTGNLVVKLTAKTLDSTPSTVEIAFGGQKLKVKIDSKDYQTIEVGRFNVTEIGYKSIDFLTTTGNIDIKSLILEGAATSNGVIYCRDSDDFYWTRRGPSCHLGYGPEVDNATYYYNEIVVPKGEDVIGTYFMANGFREGYFGIQVNAETERRILFSVWSPFHTDDPSNIPDDQKIKLLKKGKDVYTGEFGNEGSGGQSYLRYNWKADVTYKFLLKGQPDGNGNTDYTAWFYAPENNKWELIASFKRPKTDTYLKGFHSFLENFNPNQGYLKRQVEFKNQWVYNGQWHKMSQARLTVDATYRKENRVDATGGVTKNGYFLKMGGFFNEVEQPNSIFKFQNTEVSPAINFSELP